MTKNAARNFLIEAPFHLFYDHIRNWPSISGEKKKERERGRGWREMRRPKCCSLFIFHLFLYHHLFHFLFFRVCFMWLFYGALDGAYKSYQLHGSISNFHSSPSGDLCRYKQKKKWIKEGKERQPWSDTTTELKTKHEKVTHKKSEKMTIKSIVWNLINEPAIVRHTRSKRKRTRQPPWNGQRHKLAPSIKENETGTLLKKRHATISSPYSVDYGI